MRCCHFERVLSIDQFRHHPVWARCIRHVRAGAVCFRDSRVARAVSMVARPRGHSLAPVRTLSEIIGSPHACARSNTNRSVPTNWSRPEYVPGRNRGFDDCRRSRRAARRCVEGLEYRRRPVKQGDSSVPKPRGCRVFGLSGRGPQFESARAHHTPILSVHGSAILTGASLW